MTFEQLLQWLGPDAGHGWLTILGVSFLGGIVSSAACPCTLPVGLGVAGLAGTSETGWRHGGLQVSAAFFAGIVVCLTMLGAFAGQIGALATESFGRNWALAMAVVSLASALVAVRWSRLDFEKLTAWRRPGVIGTFGYGLVFSLGTSVAPLLLTIITTAGRPQYGVLIAFVFGVGRGFPFLLAGVAGSALTSLIRLGSWNRAIQVVSVVALLVVSGYYANLFIELL